MTPAYPILLGSIAAAAAGIAGVTFHFMSPYWGYSLAALGISGLIFMAAVCWSAL